MNLPVLLGVSLVPLIIGMIWYNPSVLGNAWMEAAGIKMPDEKPGIVEMLKIFIPVYIFSVFFSMLLMQLCIHQMGATQLVGGDPTKAMASFAPFMADYKDAFRTFKHGALHGVLASLFMSLFMIGTPALFENRGWKYIFIHVGFYVLCGAIMGAIICQYA